MTTGPWTSGGWTVSRHTYGRNILRYAGGGSGSYTLTRSVTYTDGTVESLQVAGGVDRPGAEPAAYVDAEVPFGPKVSSITYSDGTTSVVVPAESRRWSVLSDPTTGLSVSVVGAELGDLSYHSETSVSWLSVSVGGDPLVDSRPEQSPVETLSVFTTSTAAERRLAVLAGPRRPLLLRSPEVGTVDTWLVLVGDRTVSRITRRAGEPWRRHDWDVHRMAPPSRGRAHTADTLAELASVAVTLGDLSASYPGGTLGTLAAAVLAAEQEVRL